jgi:preprotein translocase subunit YajC
MLNILLQAAPKSGGFDLKTLVLVGGMIIVIYFFMMRPQQKKAKDQKKFRESLKKGDTVVTIGGLHGKIASLEDNDTIVLDVDKGIKLTFERSAISLEASKKFQAAQ